MTARGAAFELQPDPRAARAAREFVTNTCRDWGLEPAAETAALLTSELVTNGVLHARTPLDVTVRADERGLTVSVHDHDSREPVPRGHRVDLLADIDELLGRSDTRTVPDPVADERHALLAVGPAGAIGAGRGLLLVEALADEWGVELEADGKSVWFRLGTASLAAPAGWS